MSYSRKRGAVAQYGQVATAAEVAYASPHRLVQMLMEGVTDKIATAKGQIGRHDLEGKSKHISWAISILNGLRGSLDFSAGGEIAANLDNLYEYMSRRLMEANAANDIGILDEVTSLMVEIKTAWDALPDEVKQPGASASPAAQQASIVG